MDLLLWPGFVAALLALVGLDLVLTRRSEPTVRSALVWSAVWIGLGLGFAGVVWLWRGADDAGAYTAGYLVEKGLSVDNCFVFAIALAALAVPVELQRRVLVWGVLGALVFRGAFIAAGTSLIAAASWALYVFAALLLATAIRVASHRDVSVDPRRSLVVRALRRLLPVTPDYEGARFLVRRDGTLMATPLLAAVLVVETTDVVFALDSIPAIFAITTDPFLVFASNAFAILGLRSLTSLVTSSLRRFRYLNAGLAAILAIAGLKLALADVVHVPVWVALATTAGVLALSIAASLAAERTPSRLRRLARRLVLLAGLGAGLAAVVTVVDAGTAERAVAEIGPTLGAWTYLLVGVLAFLETAAFVGLVVPGELAVIVGGVAAAQGGVGLASVAAVAAGAAIAGDAAGFALGRRLGRSFLERHGRRLRVTPAAIARSERFFAAHGVKAIVAGRFVGLVRSLAPFLAGVSRMRLPVFVAADVAGAVAWAGACTAGGYLAAESLDAVLAALERGQLAAAGAVGAAAVALASYRRLRARRERTVDPDGGE